jgi:hypothetical protein
MANNEGISRKTLDDWDLDEQIGKCVEVRLNQESEQFGKIKGVLYSTHEKERRYCIKDTSGNIIDWYSIKKIHFLGY